MHNSKYTTVSLVHSGCLVSGLSVCVLAVLYTHCTFICTYCCLRLSLQACQNAGDPNIFGIASVDSAKMGDVSTSDWTFTMSYSNLEQSKKCDVTYKLAASGGTQFSFTDEKPTSTYVSCCSFFSVHLCMYTALLLHLLNIHVCCSCFLDRVRAYCRSVMLVCYCTLILNCDTQPQ